MIFKNKIAQLLAERNLKPADLCRITSIPTSLMSNYLTGKVSPKLDNAIKIADAFNVSLDELVGKNDGEFLTADESELISKFRELDPDKQQEILDYVDFSYSKKLQLKNSLSKVG